MNNITTYISDLNLIDFLKKINKKNLEESKIIFNLYSVKQQESIILSMIHISESFYNSFSYLLDDNRKNLEDTITNSVLFYSLSKKALETETFSNYAYFFNYYFDNLVHHDKKYIFDILFYRKNIKIILNNLHIKFNHKEKQIIINILKKGNYNLNIDYKRMIIKKMFFYDDLLKKNAEITQSENFDLFFENILMVKDLNSIKNIVHNIFFQDITRYSMDRFRKDLFIKFVLEHTYIYLSIKNKLIKMIQIELFNDIFIEIDEIISQKKNLANF